jgi:hypothetical protein
VRTRGQIDWAGTSREVIQKTARSNAAARRAITASRPRNVASCAGAGDSTANQIRGHPRQPIVPIQREPVSYFNRTKPPLRIA